MVPFTHQFISNKEPSPMPTPNRRQVITAAAFATGALATAPFASLAKQEPMQKIEPAPGNEKRTSLRQQVCLSGPPSRVYKTLLDSKKFAFFTRLPAEIDPTPGGAFRLFQGQIEGRNIELVPAKRIIQAFRPAHWDPGVYSIARFDMEPRLTATILVLNHYGFPEGDYDHLFEGWNAHYWGPLRKLFS
jgi:activator of HSP90 ATPase